jgi:uncharacterized protein YbjT (DUF2867 family)
MRILVTGATGYIGGRLVPRLLERGHEVTCLARDPSRVEGRFEGARVAKGDVFDRDSLLQALEGVDAAYYLIHSMSSDHSDFAASDRIAARIFAGAARDAKVKRIIYLGGLGDDGESLSKHLRSRHEVGETLRLSGVPVTEFRAAIIVGAGSVSFEMLRYLTDRLPIMITPSWVATRCQPISVRDVLSYLVDELERERSEPVVREIGGATVLSYKEMMLVYARVRGLRARSIAVVPVMTPRLSSAWIHLVTPIPASIARPLVDGLANEVIVRDQTALREFPEIVPMPYEEAVRRALDRYASAGGPQTTWFDAYDVRTLPGQFSGLTEGMLIDRRERASAAPPAAVAEVFSRLGGKRGWLYADALWELRGVMDRAVGGIGIRRGRRSENDLRVGDAVDFWRVETYEQGRLLRLRAEMKLPGLAWLQFEALPQGDGSLLRQTAFFEPHGIFGYLYWYSVLPFHELIFGNMAERIARNAEAPLPAPVS